MPAVEAIISAEIATTNAKPIATRRPVKMSGSACGRRMRHSTWRRLAPSACALHTSTGGVAVTPWNVCTTTGNRLVRKTAAIAIKSPTPNQRMSNGTSAVFGSE